MAKENQLSRRERQILDILHARGRATAAEVQTAMPDAPSYSAVRALLRILKEKASRSALKRVLTTFFGGSVDQAVAALLEAAETELTESEMNKLQTIINR